MSEIKDLSIDDLIAELHKRCQALVVLRMVDDVPALGSKGDPLLISGLLRVATLSNEKILFQGFKPDSKPNLKITPSVRDIEDLLK